MLFYKGKDMAIFVFWITDYLTSLHFLMYHIVYHNIVYLDIVNKEGFYVYRPQSGTEKIK